MILFCPLWGGILIQCPFLGVSSLRGSTVNAILVHMVAVTEFLSVVLISTFRNCIPHDLIFFCNASYWYQLSLLLVIQQCYSNSLFPFTIPLSLYLQQNALSLPLEKRQVKMVQHPSGSKPIASLSYTCTTEDARECGPHRRQEN